MFDFNSIAKAHGITPVELMTALKNHGWDFIRLDENKPEELAFVTRVANHHASLIVTAKAKRAEAEARHAAQNEASLTQAARNNPEKVCYKCAGKGTIRGFGHIANGTCFACGGVGIRENKRSKRK